MDNYTSSYDRGQSMDLTQAFAVLMRNVYSWMALALVITALTAMIVARDENLLYTIATTPVLMLGLFLTELGLVIGLSACLNRISFLVAGILFAVYALLNGVTMSFIFVVYTTESISQTFFITAGTFGAMSLFGYVTKRDLGFIGRILTMTLFGLIIATTVNYFMHSSGLAMVLNYVGVLTFVGLTAYDTQKIKNMLIEYSQAGVNDETSKLALLGSLTLYLDFVNLFLYILRLFGRRK